MREEKRLASLELCAGIGGLAAGLSRWCRTVGYVERDAYAQAVLLARMEDAALDRAPVWPDLERCPARAFRGAVDILVAGFPCPPFSAAGKRLGAEDERHLWPLVRALAVRSGSPLLFLENVWGAVRHPDGLGSWLADLARLGFDAEWAVVRASDVGAPHERARVFVLAYQHGRGLEELRRVWLLDRERQALGNDADRRGARVAAQGYVQVDAGRLADAERGRHHGRSLDEGRLAVWGTASSGTSEEVGHAERARRAQTNGRALDAGAQLGARGWPLVYADVARLEGRSADRRRADQRASFPPGPEDAGGWREWIAAGGPQPAVRRDADGVPARMDRLRCLGNAVVPAQAELAFELLAGRVIA